MNRQDIISNGAITAEQKWIEEKTMLLMTNAEAFRYDFGIYATELWAMTEAQFLEWCDREKPADMVVRCKDCKHGITHGITDGFVLCSKPYVERGNAMHRCDWFCADGVRKENP